MEEEHFDRSWCPWQSHDSHCEQTVSAFVLVWVLPDLVIMLCLLAGISSVSSETEERLHAAAVSVLPSLVVGNTTLNPAASKLLNHRVPMGGGGYMQAHTYTKPAAGKSSSIVSKGVRQPVPSARSSAYKYKNAPSSNASIISSAALGGKSASKYVSPYSQQYLNVLRE